VKEQATEIASAVGDELRATAEDQKLRGVEAMQGFVRAINSAAGELESQSPMVARYVRDAAQTMDGLSKNIRGRSATELMQAASDLARSQPAVFFAGAVAAGFALSRFLKSSASHGNGQNTAGSTGNEAARQSSPYGTSQPSGASGSFGQNRPQPSTAGGSTSRGY